MREYSRKFNILQLKLIGAVCTVLLNVAWCGLIPQLWLRALLGFLGAPAILIFAFTTHEGMKHTRSLTKYMLRLLVLAAVCAFPYFWAYRNADPVFRFSNYLSSPFALFYFTGILSVYDKTLKKSEKDEKKSSTVLSVITVVFFLILSVFLGVEWAPVSVIVAYLVHCYDGEAQRKYRNFNLGLFSAAILLICGVLALTNPGNREEMIRLMSTGGMFFAIPLITRYSGEYHSIEKPFWQGVAKYSFYFAYPCMLLLLALIKFAFLNA